MSEQTIGDFELKDNSVPNILSSYESNLENANSTSDNSMQATLNGSSSKEHQFAECDDPYEKRLYELECSNQQNMIDIGNIEVDIVKIESGLETVGKIEGDVVQLLEQFKAVKTNELRLIALKQERQAVNLELADVKQKLEVVMQAVINLNGIVKSHKIPIHDVKQGLEAVKQEVINKEKDNNGNLIKLVIIALLGLFLALYMRQ